MRSLDRLIADVEDPVDVEQNAEWAVLPSGHLGTVERRAARARGAGGPVAPWPETGARSFHARRRETAVGSARGVRAGARAPDGVLPAGARAPSNPS